MVLFTTLTLLKKRMLCNSKLILNVTDHGVGDCCTAVSSDAFYCTRQMRRLRLFNAKRGVGVVTLETVEMTD